MSDKRKERIKYWLQLFLLPVYGLSFCMPRSKKIWVFGSTFGRRFAENPRYLYLYICQNEKVTVHPIWITHRHEIARFLQSEGYEAYYYHSLKGIWYSLRAKVYIFDNYSKDIDFWLSGGAVKVNLWHGVGNKKINHDNKYDKIRHPANLWENFNTFLRRMSDEKPEHYILATSPFKAEIFASAFQVQRSHIIEEGLPRNDMLLDKKIENIYTDEEMQVLNKLNNWKKGKKILYCYMPTFRESETKFFEIMDLAKFNYYLQNHGMIFVTKLHPKSKLTKEFKKISYSNIYNISADVDAYSFLYLMDVLVTDYSSVYTDFLLLNRPVVGFYYDFEEYSMGTRECYYDFNEYMPELKAYTMLELMENMERVLSDDIASEARKKTKQLYFSNIEGNYSKNITQKIKNIIKFNGKEG